MSCQPPYDYTPDFIPSPDKVPGPFDCSAPQYEEHRSRLQADQSAFFRSLQLSNAANFISLEVTQSGGDKTLTVRRYAPVYGSPLVLGGSPVETEQFTVTAGAGSVCSPNDVASMRSAVNAGSSIIEMTTVGFDIYDTRVDENDCLPLFSETFMTGGEGGPVDEVGLDLIRTGPQRTMFIIRSTEDTDGSDTAPPASKRIQQWDGTQWISYCNLVGGSPQPCPLNGTC